MPWRIKTRQLKGRHPESLGILSFHKGFRDKFYDKKFHKTIKCGTFITSISHTKNSGFPQSLSGNPLFLWRYLLMLVAGLEPDMIIVKMSAITIVL